MWTKFAHCAPSCAFASFVLLFLRVCDIRVESRILLPSTLIVRRTLAVLRRLGVDAVLVLRIFPGQSEGKRLRELAVSWYAEQWLLRTGLLLYRRNSGMRRSPQAAGAYHAGEECFGG